MLSRQQTMYFWLRQEAGFSAQMGKKMVDANSLCHVFAGGVEWVLDSLWG